MNAAPSARKVFRYATVGALGTAIHLAVTVGFVELGGAEPVSASAAGFIAALIVSYFVNHRWTFESTRRHRTAFVRYTAVSALGLAVNSIIMYLAVHVFGLWYVIGQMLVVAVVPPLNFVLNRSWSFRAVSP